jgi:hypothetical protein
MTSPDDRVAVLEAQVALLAWLHAELVFQLQVMIKNLVGDGADPARTAALRNRAARLAQLRAAKAAAGT